MSFYLKKYQEKVVSELTAFYEEAKKTEAALAPAKNALPPELRHQIDWIGATFNKLHKVYRDQPVNGLKEHYPRIVIKVPTGGGKTLLAVEAIREYQNRYAGKRTGLVVWVIPTETIYSQTIAKLKDKANPLRQFLDQSSGNRTLIIEKGQRLTVQDIEENLVVLFIMIQSISRKNGKEALKMFQDAGGFEEFFPADHRYDLHAELLKNCPNLDSFDYIGNPVVKTSMGNAIRVSRPFIIIDEIHKVFSDTAKETIDGLNPVMVLGLTATPKKDMNILVSITGLELKEEEMIKLDMHIIPPVNRNADDWKSMLVEITKQQKLLEKKAKKYQQTTGVYIRPIALIQVERTGKEQRGKGFVHSFDVKEHLREIGINPDEISIKSSSQNDIEDVNLFAQDCNVRYIITKDALREGWDCSFAYMLGIVPNANSNTGVTQLVGRILRQPFARKTGVKELDESYVFYSKGDAGKVLDQVNAGFSNEGLEDIISGVTIDGTPSAERRTKTVGIRNIFKKDFASSFYLPVWVVMKNEQKRKFSYERDIKPAIDFSSFSITPEMIKELKASLSAENENRYSFIVTLDEKSKIQKKVESMTAIKSSEVNIAYLSRRYAELVENPFVARKLSKSHLDTVIEKIGKEKAVHYFDYISKYLVDQLAKYKKISEETVFKNNLKKGNLMLAVSDNAEIGYRVPEKHEITIDRDPNYFKYYLFEDVEISAMNSLEQKVGELLDKQDRILWWFRNKVSSDWYSIQGWQKNKIRPDFVAAKKNESGKLELVYVLESKGQQLLGNDDSNYKKAVMEIMTEQSQQSRISNYTQGVLDFGEVNDKVEFYFVEQGQEETEVKKRFK
ncbi:DEAD/DEAH box helicase family protein [Treponema primitia]|uniref:DEAD/DEAH box helicase n=1 Tax=Treponema primitia TaxID=88058 RepID=UPI0039806517